MKNRRLCTGLTIAFVLFVLALPINARSETVTYQGFLSNASGAPQLGSFDLTFRLYASPVEGDLLWEEQHAGVTSSEGRFRVELGSFDPDGLETLIRTEPELWLGITVGDGREMDPRQRLGATPRALRAKFADNVATGAVTGEMIADGSIPLDKLAPVCEQGQFLVMGAGGWECAEENVCAPEPEVCDGIDNDCDGQVDEDLEAIRCEQQEGVCANATKQCGGTDGYLACGAPQFGARYEPLEVSCDGLDNDCDGTEDEDLPQPACQNQKGVCAGSVRVCEGASGWLTCGAADYGPDYQADENLCDGLDNDCDGEVDEGFPNLGGSCAVGLGSCLRHGVFQCAADGNGTRCSADPGDAVPELCDGMDNDCDGEADESFPNLGSSCAVGVGSCQRFGVFQCTADGNGTQCSADPGDAVPELCDGVDNDCDGEADEGFPNLGSSCVVGVGACQRPGVFQCRADGTGTQCSVDAGEATPEICDGIDNDCDDDIDELVPFNACRLQEGVCNGSGARCGGVGGYLDCSPSEYGSDYEINEFTCDGLDNDCDGDIDEGCG